MKSNIVSKKLKNLPSTTGVYLFKDSQNSILYVGKAKALPTRVRSYFRQNASLDPSKQQMVNKIADIQTISTDTETEALVLEANLIRKHQPPYNIVLRDDKYYLFIKITTREKLPRVFLVRKVKTDGARYFGPYSSAFSARNTLNLLKRIFPHRGEKESPREKIFPHPLFSDQNKHKRNSVGKSTGKSSQSAPRIPKGAVGPHPLFDHKSKSVRRPVRRSFSVGGSLGEGGLNDEAYQQNISNIINFLKGNRGEISTTLKKGMKQASKQKYFERAAIFRDQLRAIDRLEGNQKVFLPRKESFDIISIARDKNKSAANIFAVRKGRLLNKNTFLLQHRATATPEDLLRQFILQYYRVAQDIPKTILIPCDLPDQDAIATWINVKNPPILTTPHRGKKKQLLTMGELNARQLLDEEEADFTTANKANEATKILAKALNISNPLHRIETYDISNIQGKLATGSMVVFTDGLPDKSQYKKFRIKQGGEPNDFAMLQEVLERRLAVKHDDWIKPDLILIDGGKGQLSSTNKILKKLKLNIPIASLAKREEELFIPGQSESIRLSYDSPALYLIQRMRDEAHRFTITYHRLLRSKKQRRSILDEIPGIGPKTKKQLINHFGSLKAIRSAPTSEIASIIGKSRTEQLKNFL